MITQIYLFGTGDKSKLQAGKTAQVNCKNTPSNNGLSNKSRVTIDGKEYPLAKDEFNAPPS
jgi:hypothetical protein